MPTGSSHLYIGSTLSLIAVRDSSAYVAAKHGLAGLMKSAAIDLAPKGIRANLICPGFTDTQMADQVLEYSAQAKGMSLRDFKKIMEAQSPLNRFLHPPEIADLVFYIANQKAINGEILSINGGFGLMS
jgi:NAD(P)-dependent dehydrogenase (short-subunit alcohol dehydrogenase family)